MCRIQGFFGTFLGRKTTAGGRFGNVLIRTRVFVVWFLLWLRPLWGMVNMEALGWGLPCRLGQGLCLAMFLKPEQASPCTIEVLLMSRRVG